LDAQEDFDFSEAERYRQKHLSERFNVQIPDNVNEQVIEGVLEEFEGDAEFAGTRALED